MRTVEMVRKSASGGLLALVLMSGCTLYNEVSIKPIYITPQNLERGGDLSQMIRRADFLRAYELGKTIDAKPRPTVAELSQLGAAELAGGRFDDARRHLRAALDLEPPRETYAAIAWDLSQLEYLSNNFAASLDWAETANDFGLGVKKWHLDYLRALSDFNVYSFRGTVSDEVPIRIGRPDVPRVDIVINGSKPASAVIDSGAVLSIISERLASSLPIRRLGEFEGMFYGLLGEPIPVKFGIIDTLEIGTITIDNVPVAIMPDENMSFFVSDRREFRMDFLLGANLLKEFRTELDFRRNRATFTRLQARDRKPDADQNLFFDNFRPLVRSTINQKGWFLFVLDTGSEVTFLNDSQLMALPINIYAPRLHNATLQGLGGARKRGAKVENVEIGIDKWAGTFKTLPMYSSPGEQRSVGIVGENYLRNFIVVLDFGRMRVDLQRL
jgi:hypothetical protein